MLELRLALRNLWRHKRRTLLTAIVLGFGVFLYSGFDSWFLGFEQDSLRTMVRYESGALSVHAPGYWQERDELPLDRVIPDAERLSERIRTLPGVGGATPQLILNAALNNGIDEMPVKAIGIDPLSDGSVLSLRDTVKEGRYLEPGLNEALIGRDLARLMDLGVGDSFTLVLRTERATFEAIDLEIVGLLGSVHPDINQNNVYLPLDVAQQAAELPDTATQLLVAAQGGFRALGDLPDEIRRVGKASGIELDIRTWETWAVDYLAHARADRRNSAAILALVGIIAALGIVNNVLLAGMERRREIGTLKALGMTEGRIVLLFMMEGAGIGLFGGLLGTLLAIPAIAYLVIKGVDFSALAGYDFGFAVEGVYRGVWNCSTIFGTWFAGLLLSFMVSWWPAWRSSRLDPTTVLRG